MFTALLDTNVLWPSLQRDFLLSLAAKRLIASMNDAFDDSCITGWEGLVGTYGLPDPDDEHELPADETDLAKESLDLTVKSLQESKFARKLVSPGNDSLESDLGLALQRIADGADPAAELATLNN